MLVHRAAVLAALSLCACKVKDPPPITEAWSDLFERDSPGDNWFATGPGYQVVDGALAAQGAHNKPLWLRKKLPRDFRIELDAWSNSPDGDIKIEICGDGRSFDPDQGAYQSTGYVVIFGGWHNSKSIIAEGDEHGKQMVERTSPKVVRGQRYHWTVERKGKTVTWYIDDRSKPFLTYQDDDSPLEGDGHAYLAIDNWEADTHFDNLTITPL